MKSELTFAVCAYKESPHLEAALGSIRAQSVSAQVLVATSTPSEYIRGLAEKYGAAYHVNPEKKGIAADWNFALTRAETPYVTLAHQDDIFMPDYAAEVMKRLKRHRDALICFTDYGDLLADGKIHCNRFYLQVKRLLLWAFYLRNSWSCRMMKRSALVFGNAICCPSVTYHLPSLGDLRFDNSYSVNLDWAMWLNLADRPGAFCYVPKPVMAHRIDESMETAAAIADHRRYEEDYRIFAMIWGGFIAKLLMHFYRKSYDANVKKS